MRPGLRVNDYTVLKSVRAVCPTCFAEDPAFDPVYEQDIVDGHLVTRDGAVFLRRFCRRGHGEVWSLYEEHADLWQYLQQWRVPTKIIEPDTSTLYPVPMGYENGLGPSHLQHSCIYLIDVTTQCNLACPACFTESSPKATAYLPLDAVIGAVETAIDREGGRLDVVMVSGGEPTVHPQIREILTQLAALPVTRILLNTNGIRLSGDDGLLDLIASLRDRVEIYLQYDGQRKQTHLALRGQDLREVKRRAVARLSDAKVFTTLVMVVTPENADLIGDTLRTALETPYVGGVAFQPIFGSGRAPHIDPMRRVTTTGVMRRIEEQTSAAVKAEDLIALPCSHPDCCAIGFFVKGRDGTYRSLADLIGKDVLRANLGMVGNTIAFGDTMAKLRSSLTGLMSETMTMSRPELLRHIADLCSWCDFGTVGDLIAMAFKRDAAREFTANAVKRITVKYFMDANTLIAERLEQCCVHVAGPGENSVRMPFCAARLFPKVRQRTLQGTVSRDAIAPHVPVA